MDCCRTCLSKSDLNRIFISEEKSLKCSKLLLKATGVKIEINDGLPQTICTACINYINQYLYFRKTCHKSSKTLINLVKIKHELNDTVPYHNDDVSNINETLNGTTEAVAENNDAKRKIVKDKSIANLDVKISDIENTAVFIETDNRDSVSESNDCNDDCINDNYDYNISVTVDRNESPMGNNYTEFEATIEDILKKPKDLIFENRKLNTKIHLNYKRIGKDKKKEKKEEIKKEVKEEPVECKYCHKVVKSKHALKIHYKIHTNRNIVCEHCGKKFISKRRLLIHCRGRHGYNKTDKCKFCDYRGSTPDMVKVHERLHTGERPYVCACGAAFHRRSSYLQHVPTHRPDKTVPCDECPALFKSVTLMKIHKNRHKIRRRKQITASN